MVYSGTFGKAQAYRLLFRAGFGPAPGQAELLSTKGLSAAVSSLMRPSSSALVGPAPTGPFLVNGALAPRTVFGHLHLSWLDRMVRSADPLSERMTLILHDWFGVSERFVDRSLAVDHIDLLRLQWRGSFRDTLKKVASDPAMLCFLNGITNAKWSPNENFARELMELFTLGADRGAYNEIDVREAARALTGFCCDWTTDGHAVNFRFDAARRDTGAKKLFAGTSYERSGDLLWSDVIDAIVDHPLHSSFVVLKLWSYFVPTAPSTETRLALEATYRANSEQLGPVVEAILNHPDLYSTMSMVKPPVVYIAGLLRARSVGIKTDAWIWRSTTAGQLLGQPPNVSGWDDRAWLNTATYPARWRCAIELLQADYATAATYKGKSETPGEALMAAVSIWGHPVMSPGHIDLLEKVANEPWVQRGPGDAYRWPENYLYNRQNILRQLIAAAPDAHVA